MLTAAAALASEPSSSTAPLSFLQMPLPPVPATPPLIPGAPLLPALPSLALVPLMPTLPTLPLVPGVPVPPRPPQPPLLPLLPRRRLDAGFSFERRRADDAAAAAEALPPPGLGPKDRGAGPGIATGYDKALPFLPFSLPGQYPGLSPNDVGNRVAFAVQGMTPFGTDCCNCVSNEEDYRM